MKKNKKSKNLDEWIIFEEIFKCNPQTATSYAAYFDKDYLREYLRKDLDLKNYPRQEVLFIYENGNLKLCYKVLNIETLAKKIFKKTIEKPLWGVKSNRDIRRRNDNLFQIGTKLLKVDLKKLSDIQLNSLYQKYYVAHRRMHVSGWYGNLAGYERIFADYLSKYLQKKIKEARLDWSVPEIFYALTLSRELSNAQKAELSLLSIRNFINKYRKTKYLFQKYNIKSIIQKLPKINRKIDSLLTNYVQKRGWLSYQYEGPGWDKEYFIKELKRMIIEKVNSVKVTKEIRSGLKKIDKTKKEIIKKFKIDKKHQQLWQVFTDIIFLKGHRKDSMFFGCHIRDILFKELAIRLNIPIKYIRYIYPQEMEKVVLDRKVSLELLQNRFRYHLYFYQEGVGSRILVGKKAKEFAKKLNWKKIKIEKATEFKGMCASPGSAKGKVTIVNIPEDMKKMKKGNILVSEATSPNLMSAIKKAAAIVTNVGGITCHAAIVSRELKKPCIIGTKIATKVLKDGDLVEVDADEGVVKIIK